MEIIKVYTALFCQAHQSQNL